MMDIWADDRHTDGQTHIKNGFVLTHPYHKGK